MTTSPPRRAFGVDGCRGGWIAASAARPGAPPRLQLFATFAEVVAAVRAARGLALVDVPIGLSDGPRRCDAEARRRLGAPRATSVFTPPCRPALAEASPAAQRRRNREVAGRSLSAQVLGIAPKLREVDAVLTPGLQRRIREAHPELVFAALGRSGRGLRAGKRTAAGRRARLALLPRALAAAATAGAPRFPRRLVAPDDVVDALGLLAAALRHAAGRGRSLPAGPAQRDARGLRMEIAY